MTDNKQYNRGSKWRKWDLHVHTKGTAKNDQFTSSDFDTFCVTFFKKALENKISAIGITDYFSIDNYLKVKDFISNIDLNTNFTEEEKNDIKNIFMIPNVELRMIPVTDSGKLVNIHCLFNPKYVEKLENDFFNSIQCTGSGSRYQMNKSGITNLGASMEVNLNTDDEKYKKGVDNFVVSHESLQKLWDENSAFRENAIIAVSNSNNDGASAFQQHFDLFEDIETGSLDGLRRSIYYLSQIIFSGNPEDRKYFLGKKKDDETIVKEKCGSLKPCIHGSDAHKESELFTPNQDRYCWIKADTTFEGLKQTLYEPKERVLIQERNPSDSKTKRLIIDRAIYKISSGKEKTVYFNRDLNSIIGIRGSGKSTLLKNLAQKIDLDEFSKRDKKQSYLLDNFEVVWGDNQKNGGTDKSPKSIFYIPQGYLSSLAYDDGDRAHERDAFLTQMLKKNERFANAIQSFENFVSKNKVHIEEFIQKLITANTSIKENEVLLKKQGAKDEINEEIKKKNEQIKKYKGTGITDNEVKNYSEAQRAVEDSKKSVDILGQDKDILTSIKKTGASVFISDQEFSLLSSTRQELIQKELQKKSKESLKTLIDKELVKIDAQIKGLKKIIADKGGVVKKLEEKIKKSKALEDLTKELATLEKTIDSIKKTTDKLEKVKKERNETIDAIANAYDDFESQQISIYKTIKFEEKFSFLKVEVIARYNTQQLKIFVERNINTRDSEQSIKSDEDMKILFGNSPKKLSKDMIKKLIRGLIDGKIIIKVEANDVGTVLAQLLRNRFEIDYLNSVKTIDGQTRFKDMTGGQKAIALLELIFNFDDEKYPILIDQPEDDLDVGGITSDLVNFVNAEKQDRQIIIVTHNSSLVICADTENIVVSSMKNMGSKKYNFSYATGSIENSKRRADIIEILEGGEDALRKRMLKLNIRLY